MPAAVALAGLLCLYFPLLQAQTPGGAAAIRRARAFARSHAAVSAAAANPASARLHSAVLLDQPQVEDDSAAAALLRARAQHRALAAVPNALNLSSAWSPVGPVQVQTSAYGLVTGRVTSIALDPNDTTNNTVYVGTSGGGVWKSSNAAGAQPTFAPLTDTLPVFSTNAGSSVIPSLSIGALSVQPGGTGVLLAGTGDPNDAADSYYGGGILRSVDNGTTWTLITAASSGSFVGEGFAGFAWSTVAPGLAVAAVSSSAESTIVKGSSAGVRGLYYSTDSGASWVLATIQDGSAIVQTRSTSYTSFRGNAATAVVWNPIRKMFYAAIRAHGYYESTDGQTWTRMVHQPGAGLSTGNCPARPGDYGLTNCPIFRGALAVQPTSGDIFSLTVDAGNANQGLWQDACVKSGTACTAATVTWGTQLDARPMQDGNGIIPQGDYNLALAAVPAASASSTTDTLLFAGAGDLYRCTLAGGCSLRNTTNATTSCAAPAGVAPAQHAIAWGVNVANTAWPTLYFGNDGGLWRSQDGVNQQAAACSADDATHFTNLNGSLGSLAEVIGLAAHPTDPKVLLAALGANGSAASSTDAQASATEAWTQLGTGESGAVAIDQSNGSTWLAQSGVGVAVYTCGLGTACSAADFAGAATVGLSQVKGDDSVPDPPALLDPGLNTNLLVGTCRVWRGPVAGGSTWSASNAVSRVLAGPTGTACDDADAYLRSLAAGGPVVTTSTSRNSGSSVLYAGLAGTTDGGATFAGHVFRMASANTATGTSAWTDLTNNTVSNDSNRFNTAGFDVSSIAVDPRDATGNTVYATVMGFGVPHVYRSLNGGTTWTNISANLPNSPANSVVVDPNNSLVVYVAMDTGVYVATDVTACAPAGGTGSCWSVLGTALPNAPVLSLVASAGVTLPGGSGPGALRAATYGRGVWQIGLVSSTQASLPVATFRPASLIFAPQNVGSTSVPQTVTLTNTGNAVLRIGAVSSSAGFDEADTCADTDLTVDAVCSVTVTFSPQGAGIVKGTLQVNSNGSGGYSTLMLTGTGQGTPTLLLSPTPLRFEDTAVNSTSAPMTVTVSNLSPGVAMLRTPTATGDFSIAATTCGANIGPGGGCTLTVRFTPTAAGTRTGTLALADAANNHTVTLTGTGTAGMLAVAPASVSFADTTVNTTSVVRLVTLSNSGNGPLNIAGVGVSGDFAMASNTCGGSVAAGASCAIGIAFTPTVPGAQRGALNIVSDSTGHAGTTAVPLGGNGRAAFNIVLTPGSIDFGSQLTGTASAVRNVAISNTGIAAGAVGSITVSGDFILRANTCGASLPVQTGCTVSVIFLPMANGARTGLLTVTDDAGTQTATLLGTGTAAASDMISPLSLTFAEQEANTVSAAQFVRLTNEGDVPLTLVSTAVVAGDFAVVNGCGPTVPAHVTCGIAVAFTPRSPGALTGTLQITDVQRVQTVVLNGTAIAGPGVSLLPSLLNFAPTGVGVAGAGQTITLSNNGSVPLVVTGLTIAGDFGVLAGTDTCPLGAAIPVGASCSMSVAFLPTGSGGRTGTVTIASNAPPQVARLSGTGIDFTLQSAGRTLQTVSSGEAAGYALLLRPAISTADAVTYACTGVPSYAKCTVTAQYRDLSAISTVTVTVLTGTATGSFHLAVFALPMLLGVPSSSKGRRRIIGFRITLAVFAFAMFAASQGCGTSRTIPSGDGSGTGTGITSTVTPAGTYYIAVSATAAGVTHTVPLTLVVR